MRDSVQKNLRHTNPPGGWWRSNCLSADLATDEHRWTQISAFPVSQPSTFSLQLFLASAGFPAHNRHGSTMTRDEYYEKYGSRITQASEKLFVDEFLFQIVGSKIGEIEPQYVFIDSTGKSRRIDFAHHSSGAKLALEVNGETYHAEGIIPNEQFDDNLFRQNEILRKGYRLMRFSYSQLQAPQWRPVVMDSLRSFFAEHAPHLITEYTLKPNPVQNEALDALRHARESRDWKKGVVVMPTGTGKTILSALDAKRLGGRVLFLVHRLDILSQSIEAYRKVWGVLNEGLLTGDERYKESKCDVLFASKDTLRQPEVLKSFKPDAFDYIVVDEVHHGQSPSYQEILSYFRPSFMLGMTATPDRTDRKDIFELFDYNNAYEISLAEVIERGYLVPYTYIGLTDDIDYSKIRYQNNRYRVDDLERQLIIPERNQAILDAYLDKDNGAGDKAIGFCVSIAHAARMAEFFRQHGVAAEAVYSGKPDRDEIIERFRNDEFQVVFTVDLFNEGMDFPNVRVLLFLRPTESKTVFLQQLGRGLRLCIGKDRVRVLDFIGNYIRANQIRKYLSKNSRVEIGTDADGKRNKKVIYEYSTGCEVRFDEKVEEILDQQDAKDLGYDREDLKEHYFALAEKLQRKPTKEDLDVTEHPSRHYIQVWETWLKFLNDVGEYTESSYHYPQGTHLGHILSIVWYFGAKSRKNTHFDDKFIRMRGQFDRKDGRVAGYQRQLKYKLQAAMELGILEDDRTVAATASFVSTLTPAGRELRRVLERDLRKLDLSFHFDGKTPSSRMANNEDFYNNVFLQAATKSKEAKRIILDTFLGMRAVQQMLAYFYHIERKATVEKNRVYKQFFQVPFVQRYCEQEGIEAPTIEAAKHRCPFLLNILAACGVLELRRSDVSVLRLLLISALVRNQSREEAEKTKKRIDAMQKAWPDGADSLLPEDLEMLRELFGAKFLTPAYHLKELSTHE
jgi:superfamily II DNA or RNA helicase